MRKANEPAYPQPIPGWSKEEGFLRTEEPGLSKREKLAMEIYARTILSEPMVRSFVTQTKEEVGNEMFLEIVAKSSLRAADIFFEQLNK